MGERRNGRAILIGCRQIQAGEHVEGGPLEQSGQPAHFLRAEDLQLGRQMIPIQSPGNPPWKQGDRNVEFSRSGERGDSNPNTAIGGITLAQKLKLAD
ncbi:hypothetical protein [Paramagnetospirillum magneticum]|uniref:hypothetical protein n=1 Tax=Paramagnetospirillum magneticum TaxID=84159 RepID=UPI0011D039D9|nr:hypothetical protein [Paramagnetospirillum magneticum]